MAIFGLSPFAKSKKGAKAAKGNKKNLINKKAKVKSKQCEFC